MSSNASDLIDAIMTALRASHTHYDLSTSSGTPRVDLADGGYPPVSPPFVLVAAPRVEMAYGQQQTEYSLKQTHEWWGWAPTTDLTTMGRAKSALDLAYDVAKALQDAHHDAASALYSATMVLVQVDDVFGEGLADFPQAGLVHGRIELGLDFVSRGI